MLVAEDALRLKRAAGQPAARHPHQRIDDDRARTTARGEAEIRLHPDCRASNTSSAWKEMLSATCWLPGGYPVYLAALDAHGADARPEPRAAAAARRAGGVVAAVCAPASPTSSRAGAWWVMEDAENARRMLRREAVVQGSMGRYSRATWRAPAVRVRARQDDRDRVARPPAGADRRRRPDDLWRKARAQRLLRRLPGALPDALRCRRRPIPSPRRWRRRWRRREATPVPALLARVLAPAGQAYLDTVKLVLDKPTTRTSSTAC